MGQEVTTHLSRATRVVVVSALVACTVACGFLLLSRPIRTRYYLWSLHQESVVPSHWDPKRSDGCECTIGCRVVVPGQADGLSASHRLLEMGDSILPDLHRALEARIGDSSDRSLTTKLGLIHLLYVEGDPQSAACLIKTLGTDKQRSVRQAAVRALGRMDTPQVGVALLRALDDTDDFVRIIAIEILGTRGDVNAVFPLIRLADAGDSNVACAAILSLGRIGDTRARETLEVLQKNQDEQIASDARFALRMLDRAKPK